MIGLSCNDIPVMRSFTNRQVIGCLLTLFLSHPVTIAARPSFTEQLPTVLASKVIARSRSVTSQKRAPVVSSNNSTVVPDDFLAALDVDDADNDVFGKRGALMS